MRNPLSRCLAITALLSSATPVLAHHSTAMYDYTKTLTVIGTVREFQWANPHCYIQVLVPDGKGGNAEWSIEGGTPTGMSRLGWSRDSLKPGDKVTLAFAPMRDGSHGGSFKTATLPDGKVLNGAAASFSVAEGQPSAEPQLPSLQRTTPKQP